MDFINYISLTILYNSDHNACYIICCISMTSIKACALQELGFSCCWKSNGLEDTMWNKEGLTSYLTLWIIIMGDFVGYGSRSSFHLKKLQANGVIGGKSGIIQDREVQRGICKKVKHTKSLFTIEWDIIE